MTFEEVFKEIGQTKDKYRISNLLRELHSAEPDNDYTERIKELTLHKTAEIRWASFGLLSNYVSPTLEDFFLEVIKSNNDSITIVHSIQGLSLNGTDKSVETLIETFKKSRDGQIRGTIVQALRGIYLRNNISEDSKNIILSFIGNKYPFFQGFWNETKKAKIATLLNWKELCLEQLLSNNLNVLYEYSSEIDFHIHIEKMKLHYIRYINVTVIYKNPSSSFSKFYTPSEFYLSENKLFDTLFDKTKQMRLDIYKDKIIHLIDKELIPKLIDKINLWHSLETMPFSDFEVNQTAIFNSLYGTAWDFVISHQLTMSIHRFKNNQDKNKYIDFVIQKWKSCDKETFKIKNYLEEQKNSR